MDPSDGTSTPMPFMREQCPPAEVRVCLQSHGSKVETGMYSQEITFVIPENICVYFYTEHACIYRGEPENFFRLCAEMGGNFIHQSYQALQPGKYCDNYLLESGELVYPDGRPNGWANLNLVVSDLTDGQSHFFSTPENIKHHIFLKTLIEELVTMHPSKKISIHLLMCRVDHSTGPKRAIGKQYSLKSGKGLSKSEVIATSGLLSLSGV
jgi:hypothetical protein